MSREPEEFMKRLAAASRLEGGEQILALARAVLELRELPLPEEVEQVTHAVRDVVLAGNCAPAWPLLFVLIERMGRDLHDARARLAVLERKVPA